MLKRKSFWFGFLGVFIPLCVWAGTTTTPLMSLVLPIPGPGGQPGPTWAQNLNDAFGVVDSHDHSPGKGSRVPSAGLNINSDLAMNNFNLSLPRAVRYTSQSATLGTANDKNQVYVVNGDLYYNNGSGTAIQLTSGSTLNASSVGAISGLGGTTAAETYSDITKTFTFTQSSGVTAKIAAGDLSIYENVSSANPVVIKSPTSLGATYTMTLPTGTPASKKIVTMAASGALAADYDADNSTLEVSSNNLRIKDGGVTQAKMGARATNSYSTLTATVSIASPAVVTTPTNHGLSVNDPVVFSTSGALPTGITAGTVYFVTATPSATTFRIGATAGGADINTSGSQSGTHTETRVTTSGNVALSLSSGGFTSTSGSPADVTNLSVSLTTTGRPVMVFLQGDGAGATTSMGLTSSNFGASFNIYLIRGASQLDFISVSNTITGSTAVTWTVPPSSYRFVDFPAAGTYTYKIQTSVGTSDTVSFTNVKLIAYEL